MGRIEERLRRLRDAGETALVVYLTAGDPTLPASLEYICAAAEGGADIIEVGIPFSDPTADGPTIQAASARALAGGTTVRGVLSLVSSFRKRYDTPVVLFGYYNPVFRYGVDRFCRDANRSGADGVLVVDLPAEEADEMAPAAHRAGLDWIALVAPTSGRGRIRRASGIGRGFLYMISVTGITGVRKALPPGLKGWAETVRAESRLPVAIGFGISTPAMARAASRHADAVVVGSACVRIVERHGTGRAGTASMGRFVRSLKTAMR
ncbi:MAG: tryptophan synthase subunit alpha [Deltaproteobacteria bacterium]